MIRFDHIAIAAETLEQGATYVAERSGLTVPIGGEHPLMGTHNHLMSTGPDTFFEIIAINPNVPQPNHARWFALDDPGTHDSLKISAHPHTWVLNSDDLDRDLAIARDHGIDLGQPLTVTRGALTWRFAVRPDGMIPLAGAAPMMMQWPDMAQHPAAAMPDLGACFKSITLHTPYADRLKEMLNAMGGCISPVSIQFATITKLAVELTLKDGRTVLLDEPSM